MAVVTRQAAECPWSRRPEVTAMNVLVPMHMAMHVPVTMSVAVDLRNFVAGELDRETELPGRGRRSGGRGEREAGGGKARRGGESDQRLLHCKLLLVGLASFDVRRCRHSRTASEPNLRRSLFWVQLDEIVVMPFARRP
jgi:hypothetical protein